MRDLDRIIGQLAVKWIEGADIGNAAIALGFFGLPPLGASRIRDAIPIHECGTIARRILDLDPNRNAVAPIDMAAQLAAVRRPVVAPIPKPRLAIVARPGPFGEPRRRGRRQLDCARRAAGRRLWRWAMISVAAVPIFFRRLPRRQAKFRANVIFAPDRIVTRKRMDNKIVRRVAAERNRERPIEWLVTRPWHKRGAAGNVTA